MFKLGFILSLIGCAIIKATFITTCHNNQECGSVCPQAADWDAAAFSEGLFGTSCQCQPGASLVQRCSKDGIDVYVCSDYQPPRCKVPCNQQMCITANTGRSTTVRVVSACPKHHPQNTRDCCAYGGSYCTCIKQDTVDINITPYKNLGLIDAYGRETNGWATKITVGPCGKQNTGIDIFSQEAKVYLSQNHPELCEATLQEDTYSLPESYFLQ
ncbi:hypothetical protein FGO68_gene11039 [Halteria grandinella]|uniref:Uncharacterized protein n=1 Tax=Halteria grandinella TaxID=5974 RepID=A0A8J8NKN1_HALGN|nr:hypothetical protein FGO68_gene11039 [Halteria grandinella]